MAEEDVRLVDFGSDGDGNMSARFLENGLLWPDFQPTFGTLRGCTSLRW